MNLVRGPRFSRRSFTNLPITYATQLLLRSLTYYNFLKTSSRILSTYIASIFVTSSKSLLLLNMFELAKCCKILWNTTLLLHNIVKYPLHIFVLSFDLQNIGNYQYLEMMYVNELKLNFYFYVHSYNCLGSRS